MINRRQATLGAVALMLPNAARADEVVRIPLRMVEGRPTVEVAINGEGPFLFAVNAGQGASFVDRKVSSRLRLNLIGDALEYYTLLAGVVTINTQRVNAAKVVVAGGLTLKNVSMYRMPDMYLGERVDTQGTLGRQLFVQQDCILDFELGEIRLYPKGQLPTEGFRRVAAKIGTSPTSMYGVTFEATLEGKPLRVALDTWIGSELMLSPDYVLKHGLWDRETNFAPVNTPLSANGRGIAMTDFQISPFRFDNVKVHLRPPAKDSAMAAYGIDAYVGLGLMSLFSIAFVGGKQVLLRPNGAGSQRFTS
jgi:hypothetical protein